MIDENFEIVIPQTQKVNHLKATEINSINSNTDKFTIESQEARNPKLYKFIQEDDESKQAEF